MTWVHCELVGYSDSVSECSIKFNAWRGTYLLLLLVVLLAVASETVLLALAAEAAVCAVNELRPGFELSLEGVADF